MTTPAEIQKALDAAKPGDLLPPFPWPLGTYTTQYPICFSVGPRYLPRVTGADDDDAAS